MWTLTLTDTQHALLKRHLFPGDGLEAVALLLCGRAVSGDRMRLIAHDTHLVPYAACRRMKASVTCQPTDVLPKLLEQAAQTGLSLVKIHCHQRLDQFSEIDDASDRELLPSLEAWVPGPRGSAGVCWPTAASSRAASAAHGGFQMMDRVGVIGDDLVAWDLGRGPHEIQSMADASPRLWCGHVQSSSRASDRRRRLFRHGQCRDRPTCS